MTGSWTHTAPAQRVRFATDALDQVADAVKDVGGRRVLLVTSAARRSSEPGERLTGALGRTLASVFDGARSHVPTSAVQAAVRQAQSDGVDAVVSFGGGSCADLAKAVCFFIEREAGVPGASYLDRPAIAHVAVPTTYSGAAWSAVFEMTEEGTRRKTEAGGPTIAPLAVVVDPVLTLDLPARISAETGMEALAHAVGACLSSATTPEAGAVAHAAVTALAASLPQVVDDPTDIGARCAVSEAACLAGRSLHNAGRGLDHVLARLIGGRTGIAHGLAAAILLAPTVAETVDLTAVPGQRLGDALGDPDDPAGAIDRLRERIGLPGHLAEVGVDDDDLEVVVRMSSSAYGAARPPAEERVRAVLDAAR